MLVFVSGRRRKRGCVLPRGGAWRLVILVMSAAIATQCLEILSIS